MLNILKKSSWLGYPTISLPLLEEKSIAQYFLWWRKPRFNNTGQVSLDGIIGNMSLALLFDNWRARESNVTEQLPQQAFFSLYHLLLLLYRICSPCPPTNPSPNFHVSVYAHIMTLESRSNFILYSSFSKGVDNLGWLPRVQGCQQLWKVRDTPCRCFNEKETLLISYYRPDTTTRMFHYSRYGHVYAYSTNLRYEHRMDTTGRYLKLFAST